ncbi:MAG: LacI family DNA-binding transcriptional regulator [Candidatus Omnitrophota bacterium]
MSSSITIKEVAKRAGVSIATVSRYLTNSASIKGENRKNVQQAIQELGYQPFIYARKLAGGKLNTFGLIIPGYEGIFYSFYAIETIRNIALALDKKNIDLHLHIFWNKDNFRTSLVDGVILADIIDNENQLKRLAKEKFPLVVINKKIEDPEVSYVAIDNFKGAFNATEFLVHHGHRFIAHLAGDLRVQCARERLDGYKSALGKNKIKTREEYIKITNFSTKDAREKLEELFSSKEPPTAIFCCSDDIAAEVLNFAEEKKIKIPKALSVVGFDDNVRKFYGNLAITTVRQPIDKMAATAVEILSEIIAKKTAVKRVTLDTELIVRDTVDFI